MDKEKQIEEMAIDICESYYKGICHEELKRCDFKCGSFTEAQHLYKIGYRKQSEGEWVDKPTGAYGRMQSWCSACGKHSGIGGIESNRHKPFCPNCGARMKGGAE